MRTSEIVKPPKFLKRVVTGEATMTLRPNGIGKRLLADSNVTTATGHVDGSLITRLSALGNAPLTK